MSAWHPCSRAHNASARTVLSSPWPCALTRSLWTSFQLRASRICQPLDRTRPTSASMTRHPGSGQTRRIRDRGDRSRWGPRPRRAHESFAAGCGPLHRLARSRCFLRWREEGRLQDAVGVADPELTSAYTPARSSKFGVFLIGVAVVPSSAVRLTMVTSSGSSSLMTSGLCVASRTCVVFESFRSTLITSLMRAG
jgi:hypothetical protein